MSNLSVTKKIIFNSEVVRKVQSFQPRSCKRAFYRLKDVKERRNSEKIMRIGKKYCFSSEE